MNFQQLQRKWELFLTLALLLVAVAALWAANILGWINGPWAALATIFFVLVGTGLALYAAVFAPEG